MRAFQGHVISGCVLLGLSLWWMVQLFRRYFQSLLPNSAPFRNSMTFPCSCCCGCLRTWELEGFIKFLMGTTLMIAFIINSFHDGHLAYLGNVQHATMYFFFGLMGVVEILLHYRVPLPPGLEYITAILTFSVEAILFKWHLHGRSTLDVSVHTLLLYTIYGFVLMLAVEMKFRENVLAGMMRAFFFMVHGTWFIQVGFILYNPLPGALPWDGESHDNILYVTVIYTWHLGGDFIFCLALGLIIGGRYRCRGQFNSAANYDPLQMQLLKEDENRQAIASLNDELSESDTDLERIVVGQNK